MILVNIRGIFGFTSGSESGKQLGYLDQSWIKNCFHCGEVTKTQTLLTLSWKFSGLSQICLLGYWSWHSFISSYVLVAAFTSSHSLIICEFWYLHPSRISTNEFNGNCLLAHHRDVMLDGEWRKTRISNKRVVLENPIKAGY